MTTDLQRKRSNSALPAFQRLPNKTKDNSRTRFYSISSKIVPQTIRVSEHSDDDETENVRSNKKDIEVSSSSPALHSLSKVGFQSIYQNPGNRKSQKSLVGTIDQGRRIRTASSSSSVKSNGITSYHSYQSESNVSTISKKQSQSSLLGRTSTVRSSSNIVIDEGEEERLSNRNLKSAGRSPSLHSPSSNAKKNPFSMAARKLFSRKEGRLEKSRQGLKSPTSGASSTFGKFLNSKYGKHVGKATAHHKNSAGSLIDAGKSSQSFGANGASTSNDVSLQLTQDSSLDASDVQMLHDLIKNLRSLQSNYRSFTDEELDALMSNIWGVFCSVAVTLFKNKELWELPAKIEDLNHVFSFYIKLKIASQSRHSSSKFVKEVEEFMTTCLFILENQIVFNYSNENTINTALKRLCLIWGVFYQQVYHNVIAIFLPLEISFRSDTKYWSEANLNFSGDTSNGLRAGLLSLDILLLKSFRDSIVSPYYGSFINSNEGASKSFHVYIMNEEEEKGVTQRDKLTLLQCFGILSSIRNTGIKQKVIEELLVGIRMSI
ncbi:LAME_0F18426g1_1 [Lachancea meyersii CBS 8951]|uniref:LAME_0F18426g1_1 n=1 Tax=Lachancea meyersii CBS 8951 TaxID=1266667 RepID=A0A1G4K0Q2_9SACH|nr:LAME_0F18426g1_1 [Lachancea meyersii CBS 8951]